jgi:hypothetical protein
MNTRLTRSVIVLATAGVLSVLGTGMSAATPGDRPGSGSGTAATEKATDTHAAAAYLQLLHDDIAEAVRTEDVAALGWAVEQLRPVLDGVAKAPLERATMEATHRAESEAEQLARLLPGLDMLITPVKALATTLLVSLVGIVGGLMNALPTGLPTPVPAPVPAPEALPIPEPGTEPVPLPTPLPVAGGEAVPAPEVPLP